MVEPSDSIRSLSFLKFSISNSTIVNFTRCMDNTKLHRGMSTTIMGRSWQTVLSMILLPTNEQSTGRICQATRLAKRFTATEVERNSGGKISDSYILRIENGQVANVSHDKLDALAEGLQVPHDEVHRIARGLSPEAPKEKLEILAETFDGSDLTEKDWGRDRSGCSGADRTKRDL